MGWNGWHINGARLMAGEMEFSSLTFQEAGPQWPYLYNEGNGTDTEGWLLFSATHARGFTLPKTQ